MGARTIPRFVSIFKRSPIQKLGTTFYYFSLKLVVVPPSQISQSKTIESSLNLDQFFIRKRTTKEDP